MAEYPEADIERVGATVDSFPAWHARHANSRCDGHVSMKEPKMIIAEKERGALAAINAVLVLARKLAYEGSAAELVEVLDIAEYLPMLMLESSDRTKEFREQLAALAEKNPNFALALDRF